MKNDELLRREKMLSHISVKSRSKFIPPMDNNGSVKPMAFAFLLCLPLCLTGCMGIYEGGFECPAGAGVGCKSISEVNTMVDRGELPKGELPKGGLPKIQVEPPTPINYEIWYAPRFKHHKNFPSHSGNISSSKKEDMKKIDLSDV